jgi:hypothetical protein
MINAIVRFVIVLKLNYYDANIHNNPTAFPAPSEHTMIVLYRTTPGKNKYARGIRIKKNVIQIEKQLMKKTSEHTHHGATTKLKPVKEWTQEDCKGTDELNGQHKCEWGSTLVGGRNNNY